MTKTKQQQRTLENMHKIEEGGRNAQPRGMSEHKEQALSWMTGGLQIPKSLADGLSPLTKTWMGYALDL